jgi:endo-1,3(4)-beta-glucanase
MEKLLLLLALAQSTTLVYSLPTRELKNSAEVLDERAITLSSNIDVTTSYTSTLESLQTVTATVSPSVTGVGLLHSTDHLSNS